MGETKERPQELLLVGATDLRATDLRGVAFLVGHPMCFQEEQLRSLRPLQRRQIMSRMERWIGRPGLPWEPDKYHGWTSREFNAAYVDCFVFKHDQLRLYGFLAKPALLSNRFLLFIPVEKATKSAHRTDEAVLRRIVRVSREQQVSNLIGLYSPEL